MVERLSVWGSIADREDIHVRVMDLPADCGGGALVRRADGSVWILLDQALTALERRAVLLHELVHLERGTARHEGAPPAWQAIVAREEQRVEDQVAARLVPDRELREFVQRCLSLDRFVTALDVAQEFEVPVDVAERACRRAS
jgi:hypothetical protein